MSRARIVARRPADESHEVVTVERGGAGYRRSPCGGCPWRIDQTGAFPAEAFRLSAPTAYDLAEHQFGCHESGGGVPLTCAGFLLRGADHNLGARKRAAFGDLDRRLVHDGGHQLHDSYRAMAIANGVDPSDEVLAPCR